MSALVVSVIIGLDPVGAGAAARSAPGAGLGVIGALIVFAGL
jgi:hypothetical protein